MTEKNRNLLWRVVTGLTTLPIVLYLIYLGGWAAAGLFSFAAAACAYEYANITLKQRNGAVWVTVAIAAVMPLLPVWQPQRLYQGITVATAVVFLFASAWHLVRGPLAEASQRSAQLLTAFVYGHIGLTSLSVVRLMEDGGWWAVVALVITWGNDTMAYFAGRFLGRHKLYPAVSPNKTWEGFLGGIVGAVGFLFIQRAFFFDGLTVLDCVVLGVAGSVLGPLGDLVESMIKRAHEVKDSGRILPGHGGMLDRLDALIFNAPLVLLYVQFLRPGG